MHVRRTAEYLIVPLLLALSLAAMGCGQAERGEAGPGEEEVMPREAQGDGEVRLTVTYDNNPYAEGLETSWGFSCLVEGKEKTILFDTGGDGDILLYNMSRLGIDQRRIDAVVISHAHGDHTGGLPAILVSKPGLEVYIPASCGGGLKGAIESYGAVAVEVSGARRICEGVFSSGEMGGGIMEQALLVQSDAGLLMITGCAHPGIAEMVRQAGESGPAEVHMVMGGFHLGGKSDADIDRIIADFKSLGVRYVGPCHCTGDKAIRAFSEAFGGTFIQVGVGKRISSQDL